MIDIGRKLFAFSEQIEVMGKKIGSTGAAGVNISSLRPAGLLNGAKLSAIATVFDLLFKYPGSISVYQSSDFDDVYVEISGGQYFAASDSLKNGGTPIKDKFQLIPLLFAELIKGTNSELKSLFQEILDEYAKSETVDADKVFKFCDSFYYGFAKDASVNEGTLTEAEIQAAFRANEFFAENFGNKKFFGESSKVAPAKKKAKKAEKKATSDFLQECKDGKYRIAYDWDERIKGMIKPVTFLDSFEVTPEFVEIVKKIKFRADKILERMDMGFTGAEAIGKDAMNIMLLGKPGTGKTTLAFGISAACGIPVCSTVHNKHTDEDEYEGKTKIVESKPTYVETDSLLMHQFGGIDICEEINLADPSVTMGGLGQKLEYPYIVKANGYKSIVRHPLNIVIGTMNVGTNGSNPLNQALANRFKTSFLLDDPTRETFINILIKGSKKSRELCEWVYNAYDQTVTYLKSPDVNEEEICQNLSIRTCLGAIENMEEGQTPIRALVNSIIGAIAVVDLEVARKAQRETIELLPNYTGEVA